jgi:glyoxylase-like metal-dependent hydrolase (beta-lactamase superfamily II)
MSTPSWPTGPVRRADINSDGYRVFPLVQGYPGKSTEHGGLGWSSVTIVAGNGHLVLVDTGGFGMRPMLARRLAEREVDPGDVTDVLLTHAHYDHLASYPLFPRASVWISAGELEWAEHEPPSFTPLAELYAADLRTNPRARHVERDGEILPGIEAIAAPGHTPGSLIYRVAGAEHPVLFTGDAAKNNAELLSCVADMSGDHQVSSASLRHINEVWRQRPGTVLIPGHDLPLALNADDRPRRIGRRRAHINAWFGDDLQTTTGFDLTTEKGTS